MSCSWKVMCETLHQNQLHYHDQKTCMCSQISNLPWEQVNFCSALGFLPLQHALLPSELRCELCLCIVWLPAVRWRSPGVPMQRHLGLEDLVLFCSIHAEQTELFKESKFLLSAVIKKQELHTGCDRWREWYNPPAVAVQWKHWWESS